jgi:hypothetical protein
VFTKKGISMSQGLIQGSMKDAPLPDIIQLVSQSGKTGCFHVVDDVKRAKIFLKDGRIIHAVSHDAEGLAAVEEVALWLEGHYHFEESDAQVPTTITKPNPSILMEMHRRMDEWRVIIQKVESLDLYPNSTLLPGETPSGVNPREARLLGLLTGYYTVAELAEVLAKPVLNVAKDLYGLVMAGHVIMKGVRSGRRPEGVAAPAAPAPRPEPAPAMEPAPAPVAVAVAEPVAYAAPRVEPPPPLPAPAPRQVPPPRAAGTSDPVKIAKLTSFTQRISTTAKSILPFQHHAMVDGLQSHAAQAIAEGEGPEAVKNLALSISRSSVDAGCDAELVKKLNAGLKALFNK